MRDEDRTVLNLIADSRHLGRLRSGVTAATRNLR
jgi:hypothetical protein